MRYTGLALVEERRGCQNRVPSCDNQRFYGESLPLMPLLVLIATLLLHSMLPRQPSIVVGTPTLLWLRPLLVHCYCSLLLLTLRLAAFESSD